MSERAYSQRETEKNSGPPTLKVRGPLGSWAHERGLVPEGGTEGQGKNPER